MKCLEHVHVLIHKDTSTHIKLRVPSYEVPVLREMYDGQSPSGEAMPRIFVQGEPEFDPIRGFNADQALGALRRKYRKCLPQLAQVYKTPESLTRAVVIKDIADKDVVRRPVIEWKPNDVEDEETGVEMVL